MNVLKPHKKVAILNALLEGCSIRSASRLTGSHIETVLKLLVDTGRTCDQLLNDRMRDISCEAVECDEIWGFIGKKERLVTKEERLQNITVGDCYTFIALDPDSKAVITYALGRRDLRTTWRFIRDLRGRVVGSPQISTDGFASYIEPIRSTFGPGTHYAQVVKHYAHPSGWSGRYSPPKISGQEIIPISGKPSRSKISTSYVERNNLTLRMNLRRLTRLTNAFSRKYENLKAALSLWFAYYNFCRIHGSLRVTPAMEAGVTTRIWTIEDLMSFTL